MDAAKDISKALATQSSFKKALWKDLFTGRLKDEIPRALVSYDVFFLIINKLISGSIEVPRRRLNPSQCSFGRTGSE